MPSTGAFSSRAMIVMITASTPSLKASRRPVSDSPWPSGARPVLEDHEITSAVVAARRWAARCSCGLTPRTRLKAALSAYGEP